MNGMIITYSMNFLQIEKWCRNTYKIMARKGSFGTEREVLLLTTFIRS